MEAESTSRPVLARKGGQEAYFLLKYATITGWVLGKATAVKSHPAEGQTHLSSVDPRFSISLATSAISSFSLYKTQSRISERRQEGKLKTKTPSNPKQNKAKGNKTTPPTQNLKHFGKFNYSTNIC